MISAAGAPAGSRWRGATIVWLGPAVAFALVLLAWQALVLGLAARTPVAAAFGPVEAARAFARLVAEGELWRHARPSLGRVALGLVAACAIGIPVGLAVGLSRRFAQATTPAFQFLRMVSPLSWMPLAVMVLGIGDAPVVFLLGFAAVWPMIINTAAGVQQLDPAWLLLARSVSASRAETILRVVLPGIMADLLTGVRLAIGLIWIVLVPAEMLGVSTGLGYLVLDTRDRLAYSELMAAIGAIGAFGYLLDTLARGLHRRWLHAETEPGPWS